MIRWTPVIRTWSTPRVSETVGDYLCGQVRRWLKKDDGFQAAGKDDIKITFQYSHCGNDWKPVNNEGATLYTKESLCCNSDGSFRRCDGSDYVKFCPEK